MRSEQFGIIVGLVLGLAWAFGSFGRMILVAILGAVGFVVVKIMAGEIDVSDYIPQSRSKR